jgi:rhodanese-related sulfurtransferase
MKKLISEILLIMVFSTAIGMVYNMFTPKPLPLLYKKNEVQAVSDSTLMNDLDKEKVSVPVQVSPKTESYIKDTIPVVEIEKNSNIANQIQTKEIQKEKPENKPDIEKTENVQNQKPILKFVNYKQMLQLINNPNVVIIDARGKDDFDKGHIGNAVNIFPYDEQEVYYRKLSLLQRDKLLVCYCDGGNCDLSHDVCNELLALGYQKVYLYPGGWEDWLKNNKKNN